MDFFIHHGQPFAWRGGAFEVPYMKEHIGRSVRAADKAEGAGGVPADDGAFFLHR
ncbi:hypothetical protein D3C80_2104860 [compost metagenome]